jgi:hypothetical protein
MKKGKGGNEMGKLGTTWMLMKASFAVIRGNKRLLILPVFSGVCMVLILVSFAAPVVMSNLDVFTGAEEVEFDAGYLAFPAEGAPPVEHVRFYGVLFTFYFANYFVIIFFNSALVASAFFWMRDGRPSLSRGMAAAVKRLPQIVGWALLSATVGLALRLIENAYERAGAIVAWLLGTAWTVTTYLAVPVLVVEGKGPFAALKESTVLLKKSWGEQLIGGFAFGLFYGIFFFLGVIALAGGLYFALGVVGSAGLAALFVALAVIYFLRAGPDLPGGALRLRQGGHHGGELRRGAPAERLPVEVAAVLSGGARLPGDVGGRGFVTNPDLLRMGARCPLAPLRLFGFFAGGANQIRAMFVTSDGAVRGGKPYGERCAGPEPRGEPILGQITRAC